jgi:hypothetical protein
MAIIKLGEHHISKTIFQIEKAIFNIDTYHCQFKKWQQTIDFDTYGGKAIVEINDEPLFAELYVLRLLESQGFKGVWVDTYRGKFWNKHPTFSMPVEVLPILLNDTYDAVKKQNNNKRKGCWDVLAFRDNEVIFAELKRVKKDAIRQSQIDWLNAAKNTGLSNLNFIIVEWDYIQ